MSVRTNSGSRSVNRSKTTKTPNAVGSETSTTLSSPTRSKKTSSNQGSVARKGSTPPNVNTLSLSAEARNKMIEECAYFRALKKGFQTTDPVQDWLEAEAEINDRIAQGTAS